MKYISTASFLVLVACFVLLFLQHCRHSDSVSGRDTLENNIIINYDSSKQIIVKPNIYNSYSIKLDAGEFPTGLDTSGLAPMIAEIVKAYFEKHVDVDVRRDSNIEATIQDTIFTNRRIGRLFTYKLLKPQVIHSTAVLSDKRRSKVYFGFAAGIPDNELKIDLSTALILPNDRIIGLDYDITSNNPTLQRIKLRYLHKISIKPP